MATYDYYKLQQGGIPAVKHGSNWFWIRVDYSKQPCAAGDVLKACEIKSGSILKSGFTRVTFPTLSATTMDIGTTSAGLEIDAAVDTDSTADTWLRVDTLDDDGPIKITSDDYIYIENIGNAANYGIIDVLLEVVVVGNADLDRWTDSLAEAN